MTAVFGTEERAALDASVDGLLRRRSPSTAVRRYVEDGGFDRDLWREMADLGWMALLVPEDHGGLGAGLGAAAIVLAGLGRYVTPGPYLSTAVVVVTLMVGSRDGELRRLWLPKLASGEAVAAAAISGPTGRTAPDLLPFESTGSGATRLDGRARLVLDAPDADLLVVGGRDRRQGPLLAAVPADAPGVLIERHHGIDRTRSVGDVVLDGVELDDDAIIAVGDDVPPVLDRVIDTGMVALSADAIGAATRALHMSIDYAKERHQFGRAIGSFQAIKHKLADMYVLTVAADAAVKGAASSIDGREPDARRRAAVAGSFCRTAAARIAGDAVQVHGGVGFTWEHDCHLLLKRAKLDLLLLSDVWAQGERLVEGRYAEIGASDR